MTAKVADRQMRRAGRRTAAVLLAAALSLLVTSCLDGNVGVKVNSDGSGSITVEVVPDARFQKGLERLDFDVEELYDLRTDPAEERNLAGDPAHARTLEEKRRALAAWRERVK